MIKVKAFKSWQYVFPKCRIKLNSVSVGSSCT